MKCPACGHWNKPTFPRCFKCGEPLQAKTQQPEWRDQLIAPPAKDLHVVYDDAMPYETDIAPAIAAPETEPLAAEMARLKERRERGVAYLSEFRKSASEKGIAPSGAGVSIQRMSGFFQEIPDDPEETLFEPIESRQRKIASVPRPVARRRRVQRGDPMSRHGALDITDTPDLDMDIPPSYDDVIPLAPSRTKHKRAKYTAQNGPVRLAIWAIRILVVGALLFALWQGYTLLLSANRTSKTTEYAIPDYTMTAITIEGYPGQRVLIAGEEGAQFYISELRRSYVVVGGVATIDVPDHVFYDTIENIDVPQMSVSLTPTLRVGMREERLQAINYVIDIPLSPITLIAPEVNYIQVSTSIYNMQMQVLPGSRVIVNGENISDSVNEDGVVTYNPPVHAIGENIIRISVSAVYHRENNMIVTLYRPVQEVPLELLADTTLKTSKEEVVIHAATAPNAVITIESPYRDLVTTQIEENGNFSFTAILSKVGYNTIRIRASLPEREDSVLEHNIYYLPTPEKYTVKAWALSATDYKELLNNIVLRISDRQIYLCRGVIKQILSEKPQLAIMDTGTDGNEQLVLLQNESMTVWEVGKSYRVYADVSGLYGNMPRFNGRYTYNYEYQ